MTDGSVARPLDFRKEQREQTAEMTSATVCDEASHGRSVEEHFEHRYQESRAVFEKDRASQAAFELRRNRQSLEAALEPLRLLQCAKVASETTDVRTAPLAHERSRRKRRQKAPSERLEAGKSVGIKLDVRSSDVPQHYRARILPAGQTIPVYTSWSFVSANQQQRKVHNQKRLFYTDDDTGETLPASEDEDEVQSESHRRWDSRDVEWREFCLARLREEGWETATFLPLLAEKLGVETSSIEERIRRENAPETAQETVVQLCRRCLRYNCSLHPESNVLPALQPPPRAETPDQPCGPRCYLNDAVEDSTPWGEGDWESEEIDLLEKVSVDRRFMCGKVGREGTGCLWRAAVRAAEVRLLEDLFADSRTSAEASWIGDETPGESAEETQDGEEGVGRVPKGRTRGGEASASPGVRTLASVPALCLSRQLLGDMSLRQIQEFLRQVLWLLEWTPNVQESVRQRLERLQVCAALRDTALSMRGSVERMRPRRVHLVPSLRWDVVLPQHEHSNAKEQARGDGTVRDRRMGHVHARERQKGRAHR